MSPTVTPIRGKLHSTARLNIRLGAPSTSAPISRRVDLGTELIVHGRIHGENVYGNNVWYAGDDDTYFWSGAVSDLEPGDGSRRIPALRRADGSIKPLPISEIERLYGKPSYSEAGGGRVNLDAAWKAQNLVEIHIPALAGIDVPTVTVHRKAAAAFQRVFAAIAENGLNHHLLTCAGTFVARHKGWDPSRTLSAHSWGIAIDLNAAWNSYGNTPAPPDSRGSILPLVPFFEAEGFAWGGHFQPGQYLDGMHFELARTNLEDDRMSLTNLLPGEVICVECEPKAKGNEFSARAVLETGTGNRKIPPEGSDELNGDKNLAKFKLEDTPNAAYTLTVHITPSKNFTSATNLKVWAWPESVGREARIPRLILLNVVDNQPAGLAKFEISVG